MFKSKSLNNMNYLRRKSYSWEQLYNTQNNIPLFPKNKSFFQKHKTYFLKFILHCLTHICLLSLLEPIFFFQYANKIETSIFLDNLTNKFKYNHIFNQNFFSNIRKNKILYNALIIYLQDNQQSFQKYINHINNNALNGFQIKEATNTFINIYAFQMFYILSSILLVFLFGNYLIGKNNYFKIFCENLILILFIGLYEFWFFKNIILNFIPISNEETNRIFIQCTLNNIQNNFPELQYLTNSNIPPECN